jgi:tetratricopeptide (TPR) repeat protein
MDEATLPPTGEETVRAIERASREAHPGVAPRKPVALAVAVALALVAARAGAAPEAAHPRGETPAAREQARLCERLNLEEGVAACRAALALGIGPDRRGPIRQKLARHLVALERWDELAELLRENVRLEPDNADAWQRLGLVLLFALDEPEEAIGALQEATRRAPTDSSAWIGLGLALHAGGRGKEAAEAIEAAARLDPAALDGRPAARAVLEAARRGEAWP